MGFDDSTTHYCDSYCNVSVGGVLRSSRLSSSSSLLQMGLHILVQRTLAGPMAHMGANTSPSPQARTYILQPLSCTTHKVMLRN